MNFCIRLHFDTMPTCSPFILAAPLAPLHRVLTGIPGTGTPHLGSLLGAIGPAITVGNLAGNDAFLFIADLSSLYQGAAQLCAFPVPRAWSTSRPEGIRSA